jgi:hypothetical protein
MTPHKDQLGPVLRGITADGPLKAPRFVWLLLSIAVALGIVYLIDIALGRPGGSLSAVVDLDGEANLPTWFSSIQWFTVAALMLFVVDRRFDRSDRRSWFLWILPLVFLAFSMDEVVKGHEYAGVLSDAVLPGGTRDSSALPITGAFGLTIGIPFILVAGLLLAIVRPYLQPPAGAFKRIAIGTALFLLGAVGFDFLSNFLTPDSAAWTAEIYVEETLEMFGATLILWGAYLLAMLPGGI